ncbi:MAG: hypothetical protein CML17_11025, partial [Pusillimonas sp.]|nr:hypothetical protein [Pusillimonas sp.]
RTGTGSATSPAFQVGDDDCGFFDSGANEIGVTLGGVLEYEFTPTQFNMESNNLVTSGTITSGQIRAAVATYAAGIDEAYLIASTSGWTGATTNWNTYGIQHRIKTSSGGVPRVTIDTPAVGEVFSVDNNGDAVFSGDVMVGKSVTSLLTAGIALNSNGAIYATVESERCLILNRETSNGSIAEFRKDNSIVGTIGVDSGDNLYITSTTANHAGLYLSTNLYGPLRAGSLLDDAISIGNSAYRYKDLQLSGTAYAGELIIGQNSGLSGTQVYIKKKDNSTNLQRWGEGTSGASTYRFRIDQNFAFIANNGTNDLLTISSSNGSITTSGNITSHDITTDGVVRSTNNANADGPNFNVSTTNKDSADYAYRVDRSGTVVGGIRLDGRVNGQTIEVGATTVITSARNLTNIGTGTFSGTVTGQKLVSTDGVLELDDNGTHNGIINVPASLRINIDSDNNGTGESFQIGSNVTNISGSNILFQVSESGIVTTSSHIDFTASTALLRNQQDNSGQIGIQVKNSGGTAREVRWDAANNTNGAWRPTSNGGADLGLTNKIWNNLFVNTIKMGTGNVEVIDSARNISASSLTTSGDITVSGNQVFTNSINARVKFAVWSNDTYGIGMTNGVSFGGIGGTGSEYAMTFQMSNTATRGFVWLDTGHSTAKGAMALTTEGQLTVANATRIGFGQEDTTPPNSATAMLDVNGDIQLGSATSNARLFIRKADDNQPDHINIFCGSTQTGQIGSQDTTWLRINQTVNKNIYTPRYIRADSGFFVDNTSTGLDGSGRLRAFAGSTSSVGIGFANDIDTGFYRPAANTIDVVTAGDAHARFDSTGNLIVEGNVTAFGSVSDIRLKERIQRIADPVSKVQQLDGVTFEYKKTGVKSTGLIAQQLLKVLPEVVYQEADIQSGEKHYAVRYGPVVGLLVEAIKEQQQQIDSLKDIIKEMTNGNNENH